MCVKYRVNDCIIILYEHVIFGTRSTDRTFVLVSVVVVITRKWYIFFPHGHVIFGTCGTDRTIVDVDVDVDVDVVVVSTRGMVVTLTERGGILGPTVKRV